MWPVYNLVRPGDTVTATTFRKVAAPGGGGGGGPDAGPGGERGAGGSERLKLRLAVTAASVDYDPAAATVRVGGAVTSECAHVRLGSHHTLELAPHRSFALGKAGWDALDLAALAAAANPAAAADLAALLIDVSGTASATLALVGGSTTSIRARLEAALPKKKGAAAAHGAHDKALAAFYDKVAAAIARHVDWGVVRCLVIAGPGFGKDGLAARLAARTSESAGGSGGVPGGGGDDRKALAAALKDRVVLAHASSAYKHSLREVLADPSLAAKVRRGGSEGEARRGGVCACPLFFLSTHPPSFFSLIIIHLHIIHLDSPFSQIADTKAARETAALASFFEALATDSDRAWYGPAHVAAAAAAGAVGTLLLSDSLVRAAAPPARRAYAALADTVRASGGVVHTLSGGHVSGEQLDQVTGVAALLRFPMPELDDTDVDAGLPGIGT
jgi:protein pelota